MTLISVTRLRIRSIRFLPMFIWDSIKSDKQAKRASGNLGSTLRAQSTTVFWTLTAWEDEASMRAFMRSGAHREAMPKLQNWCDEASVVHWHQDSASDLGRSRKSDVRACQVCAVVASVGCAPIKTIQPLEGLC